jgi:hypothetical protein
VQEIQDKQRKGTKVNTVLFNDNGEFFCQDGNFRSFSPIGTSSFCMKIYKKAGCARNAAEKKWLKNYSLVHFYPERGESIDCCGRVIEANGKFRL